MQHGNHTLVIAQQGKGVVFHGEIPISRGAHTFDFVELAAEMSEQIQHVNPLIQQNTPAGHFRQMPPLVGITGCLRLAVNAPHPHNFSVTLFLDNLFGFHYAKVVAVVKTDF